jgi:hypothetical protein
MDGWDARCTCRGDMMIQAYEYDGTMDCFSVVMPPSEEYSSSIHSMHQNSATCKTESVK